MASHELGTIVEVVLTYFPDHSGNWTQELSGQIRAYVMAYLCNKITFEAAKAMIYTLTGTLEPIERARQIVEMKPDPIPVMVHMQNEKVHRRKAQSWTGYEDQRLLAGIMRYGIENWTSIAQFIGNGRTRGQCSQRWYRGLDPKISKYNWSSQEDGLLLRLVNNFGEHSWTQIASYLRRSDVQCRYRYKQIVKEGHFQELSHVKERQYKELITPPMEIQIPVLKHPSKEVPKFTGTKIGIDGKHMTLPPIKETQSIPKEANRTVIPTQLPNAILYSVY